MVLFSKITAPKGETYDCHEVMHTWNPNCEQSAIDMFLDTMISSSKIYSTFYLISILTRRKFLTPDVFIKYIRDVVTSSVFLSFNSSGYIYLVCFMRRFLGKFDRRASYIAGVVASYIAINFEQKNRRQALALYVANVASETLFWMLHSRGYVKKVPYGDVFLMSIASAILVLLYRKEKLKGVVPAILNIMINKKSNDEKKARLKSNYTSNSSNYKLVPRIYKLASYIHQFIQNISCTKSLHEFIIKLMSKPKHNLCCHQNGCLFNAIMPSLKVFSIGYIGRLFLTLCINILKRCFKTSHQLTTGIKHKDYAKFGGFLAGFVLLHNMSDCLWRHVFDEDSSQQAIASGFIAGLSICIYRSPSIAVYLFWKAIEGLWLQLLENHPKLNFPHGIEVFYSLSTALLVYAGTVEAHNVRPAYMKFLLQATNQRFGMINSRLLLDEFNRTQKVSQYFLSFPTNRRPPVAIEK